MQRRHRAGRLPATATMMSPARMPALAAAPPGVTLTTPTPAGWPLASITGLAR